MKLLLGLLVGILIGAGVYWFYNSNRGKSGSGSPGAQVEDAAKSAGDATQEKMRALNLRPEDIKEDLARTGKVIRRKAREVGQAIADGTADARITAAIKAKLLGSRDLSVLSISVNTTAGVVTLSGTVSAPEDIGKAMLLALETDGVHEVISTLQVSMKPK